ncbi:methyltransferase family protein [Chloroflexota bacterium]
MPGDAAGSPTYKPFTSDVYRFSRYPMYLSVILVYLGVSIVAASWLFLLITVIIFFLQRYHTRKEERYCCGKSGDDYGEYTRRITRSVGISKSATD